MASLAGAARARRAGQEKVVIRQGWGLLVLARGAMWWRCWAWAGASQGRKGAQPVIWKEVRLRGWLPACGFQAHTLTPVVGMRRERHGEGVVGRRALASAGQAVHGTQGGLPYA